MTEEKHREPDPQVHEALLSKKLEDEEEINDELILINPGNKRRRMRPSDDILFKWVELIYNHWETSAYVSKSSFRREVDDTLVPTWKVSFHTDRTGVALASKTVRTKIAQLRVFWKFWISENCLFYTTLTDFDKARITGVSDETKLTLFSRYSNMKSSQFKMRADFSQLRIDELSSETLLLLSLKPQSPEVTQIQVQTAKALIPFPRSLLDFLKMRQVVACLGHFVKKAVVVYRMSPAYIGLILNTLRANVLVFYRWKLGSNAQLQRVLVALENLTRQLGTYGRIERRRFGAANTSLTWLDFQLMRHVFARKVAIFLFTNFDPSDFDNEEKMRSLFVAGHPTALDKKNKEWSKAYKFMQLATGISQLMLLGCLSGPTLRPEMLPNISRKDLGFNPLEKTGADARWVYSYSDSFNPFNFNKVSKVQTEFAFPFSHFLLSTVDAERWAEEKQKGNWKKWKKQSTKLLKGSWYEDEGVDCFSVFNLMLTLFFQTPLGAYAHLSVITDRKKLNSERTRAEIFTNANLQGVGWTPGKPKESKVFMLLPSLNREFDIPQTIRKSVNGSPQITTNSQENVLKLLYESNSCVFVKEAGTFVKGFKTWKQQDTTVQKCRHLFETANSLVSSNLVVLGMDDFMGEDQKKRQELFFGVASRTSLHSVQTAQSVYVSNKVMLLEALKIVRMLDHLIAQHIFSQDTDLKQPSEQELNHENKVLYYYKNPIFGNDQYDFKSEDQLRAEIMTIDEAGAQEVFEKRLVAAGTGTSDLEKNNFLAVAKKTFLIELLRTMNATKEEKKEIPLRTGSSLFLTVKRVLHDLFLAVGMSKEDNSKNCEQYFWSFEMMRIKPENWAELVAKAQEIQATDTVSPGVTPEESVGARGMLESDDEDSESDDSFSGSGSGEEL